MKAFRSPFRRFRTLDRTGAVNCALACSLFLAVTLGSMSLDYWSGRTVNLIYDAWQGMTVESYRNLALVTALLGWLVSQAPNRNTTHHRRPYRP